MPEKPPYYGAIPDAAAHEAYEQNHWKIVELLGRLSAQAATNYRADRPRGEEHLGKQEEVIAGLTDMMELMEG